MFYRKIQEGNSLVKIFDYGHFSLYGLRAASDSSFELIPESSEMLAFSLKGGFSVNGQGLEEKDMAYIPSGFRVRVSVPKGGALYVAESRYFSSFPFYVKRYREVESLEVGVRNYARRVKTMIGEGDPAVSFLAGYTEEYPGNWSSYPPHRHEGKPEAYVFYGVDPGYAVQMSMKEEGEEAYVVHDYDVFLVTGGYHPHVSSPLTGSGYAWVIAAPLGQRKLEVEVHPSFRGEETGRTHLTIK
ncbi:5-deoxy-glucuronate isomerase [Tardisphaera miroshnichenkoae]